MKKGKIAMKFNVFPKKITAKNTGKVFTKYITTLTNHSGEKFYTEVKFSDEAKGKLEYVPCEITINKEQGNFTSRTIHGKDRDGNDKDYTRNTLWVKDFEEINPYNDTSLDEFE